VTAPSAPDLALLPALARAAIEDALDGGDRVERVLGAGPRHPALEAPAACFVTLRLEGELRGCIGGLEETEPLSRAVRRRAVQAAFEDPRFTPLTPDEAPRLEVEVSVLSPLRRVRGPQEIEPGRHGVVLGLGDKRSVFLPQVAAEQGWDATRLLEQLARKAGLPPHGWKQATLEVFETTTVGSRRGR
jgi:AmmeMemoRadiSam system protein A